VRGSRRGERTHNRDVGRAEQACLAAEAEADLVAQRIRSEGTHTGVFQGLPPTNRRVEFSGLELNRFVEGRVAEHWFQLDALGLLQQLGLIVLPGPRLLPRLLNHQVKNLGGKR
jgi:hypothetical protein